MDFICAEAGLCNKLRSVLSYRLVAQQRGRRLVVLWRRGPFCDAEFSDLFEPLSGVTFISDAADLAQTSQSALEREGGPSAASVYDSHPQIKYTDAETEMYRALVPLPSLREAVVGVVGSFNGPFVAVHMRRTDHSMMFGDRTPDSAFCTFLDRHTPLPIFLATDNADTQRALLRRYPDRIRVVAPIQPSPLSDPVGEEFEAADVCSAGASRHTSIQYAVVDLFTCVEATHFMGTYLSSFSDTIYLIRRMRGFDTSNDEHIVRSLGGKHYDPEVHSLELAGNEFST
mmetsp:Transcript_27742/g.84676  ORF Transcript_27742/g.84676 Transcript_27742/m.84676 type:complete len:286 (+) Transcript_27742:161-1018(+)